MLFYNALVDDKALVSNKYQISGEHVKNISGEHVWQVALATN